MPPTPFSGRSEPTHSVPVDSACFPGAESPESRPSRALGGRVRKILSNSPPRVDAGDPRLGHSRTPGPHARRPRAPLLPDPAAPTVGVSLRTRQQTPARTPLRPGGPTWQPQRSLPHADACPRSPLHGPLTSRPQTALLFPHARTHWPVPARVALLPGLGPQTSNADPRRALSRSFHIPRSRSSLAGVKRNQGRSASVVLPTDPCTLLK